MIVCRSPVRVDFGGGGTDIEPYSTDYGGFVVNTSINKFVRTIVSPRTDPVIKIISSDYSTIVERNSIDELRFDTEMDLVKAIVKRMNPTTGVDVIVRSDIPVRSGLGASASLSTSVIGALKEVTGQALSDHEIAEMGFIVEREDLKNVGGRQDQYASVFGGFNQIEFLGGSNVKVSKLNVSSSFKNYLNDNMVLAYTGKPHTSGNVLEGRVERYEKEKEVALECLNRIKEIAMEEKDALVNEDFEKFADLLTIDWEFKTKLNPRVTTDRMRLLDKAARSAGAIGARFCGAGAGGCMIWLCKEGTKAKVADSLVAQGAKHIDYNFNDRGYEIFKI